MISTPTRMGPSTYAPIYITVKNTDTVLPLPEVDLIIAIDTGGGDGSNWLPEFWNFQTGSIIKAFSSSTKIGPLNPGQSVTIGKGKQINKNWYVVVDEDCPLYTTHTLKTIVSTDTPWRNVVLKTNEFYFKVEPPTLRIDVVLGAIGAGIASLAAVYYAGTRFRWW